MTGLRYVIIIPFPMSGSLHRRQFQMAIVGAFTPTVSGCTTVCIMRHAAANPNLHSGPTRMGRRNQLSQACHGNASSLLLRSTSAIFYCIAIRVLPNPLRSWHFQLSSRSLSHARLLRTGNRDVVTF